MTQSGLLGQSMAHRVKGPLRAITARCGADSAINANNSRQAIDHFRGPSLKSNHRLGELFSIVSPEFPALLRHLFGYRQEVTYWPPIGFASPSMALPMPTNHKLRSAFTLVELLVVIAI